jgi:hypothetical protein
VSLILKLKPLKTTLRVRAHRSREAVLAGAFVEQRNGYAVVLKRLMTEVGLLVEELTGRAVR